MLRSFAWGCVEAPARCRAPIGTRTVTGVMFTISINL